MGSNPKRRQSRPLRHMHIKLIDVSFFKGSALKDTKIESLFFKHYILSDCPNHPYNS